MSTPPPKSSGSGRRTSGLVVAALIVLVIAGTALAAVGRVEHRVDDRHRIAAAPRLVIRGGQADIVVTATARTDVEVHRVATWSGPDEPGVPSTRNGTIRLAGCRSAWWKSVNTIPWMCRTRYELAVPAGTALDITSGSGDVRIAGTVDDVTVSGGSGTVDMTRTRSTGAIVATVGSGDLHIGPGGRAITATTGSGDVVGDRITADRVRARTGSGSVTMSFATAPSDVSTSTGAGGITLRLPVGGYRIEADASAGDTNVDRELVNGQSPRVVTARSGSGDVTVRADR